MLLPALKDNEILGPRSPLFSVASDRESCNEIPLSGIPCPGVGAEYRRFQHHTASEV